MLLDNLQKDGKGGEKLEIANSYLSFHSSLNTPYRPTRRPKRLCLILEGCKIEAYCRYVPLGKYTNRNHLLTVGTLIANNTTTSIPTSAFMYRTRACSPLLTSLL